MLAGPVEKRVIDNGINDFNKMLLRRKRDNKKLNTLKRDIMWREARCVSYGATPERPVDHGR